MARTRSPRIDKTPFEAIITDLTHDGRGVARWPEGHPQAGKAVFVAGALPGETVRVRLNAVASKHAFGSVVEVVAFTGLRASLLPQARPKGLAKRRAAEPEAVRNGAEEIAQQQSEECHDLTPPLLRRACAR